MDTGIKDYRLESYLLIEDERDRQVELYGTESILIRASDPVTAYLEKKLVILMEEVGELAHEVLERRNDLALDEAVQVAAVAMAIVEGLLEINEK